MQPLSPDTETLLGIQLSQEQEQAFARYAAELADWNQRINLTAITEPEEVRIKHFLDSLSCWLAMRERPGERLIDVGSGAGFPGLPLKILRPELQLTLVESVGKKCAFLQHLVQVLGLEGVEVLNLRAEEAGQLPERREKYDWAVARAVAELPVLVEYLLPLAKLGGSALAQKGGSARLELQASESALKELGGEAGSLLQVGVPGIDEQRWLVTVNKVSPTPDKYPRRPGMPAKRPLS